MNRSFEPPPLPVFPPPLPSSLTTSPALPLLETRAPVGQSIPFPPPLPVTVESEPVPPPLPRQRSRNEFQTLAAAIEWVFGFFCMIGALAILATLPILQFLSLGYMLEAAGRIARTGRIRSGFIGIRPIARVGGIVIATWLFLWPVRFLADFAHSATIIDPDSRATAGWRFALYFVTAVVFLHITLACARGGKLRYFIWPFNLVWFIRRLFRGGYYTSARDAVWDFTMSLRLPHYFWLGMRGFAAAFAWLVLPVSLLALGHSKLPGAPVLGVIGGIMLGLVLMYLPFMQVRLASTGRFAEGFNLFAARRAFKCAPWAFAFSFVITLLFALPLYLFKIEIVPEEAAWLPGLIFIAFIYPARLMTGWALGRAMKREGQPRHWFFRVTGRLPFVPVAAFYVVIVFFTQYTSWNGVWSLYEQHAFLVPVPFFGM
jgi:hypothetical protein